MNGNLYGIRLHVYCTRACPCLCNYTTGVSFCLAQNEGTLRDQVLHTSLNLRLGHHYDSSEFEDRATSAKPNPDFGSSCPLWSPLPFCSYLVQQGGVADRQDHIGGAFHLKRLEFVP